MDDSAEPREPDRSAPSDAIPAVPVAGPGGGANPLVAWACLLAAGIVWGATFSLAKIATAAGAHPLGITLWQGLMGAALLLAVVAARRRPIPLDRTHLTFYVVCGFLGTALPSTLFFYAANHISAGVLSIAVATVPMLTFAAALPLGLERHSWIRLLGLALGMAAIALIAAPEASLPGAGAAVWVMMAVGAAACYAVENTFIALRRPRGSDAFTVLCGMLAASAVMMTPVVLATGTFTAIGWPWAWDTVAWSVFGMAVINVFGYGTFVFLVTYAGPVFASQTAYVVTLSGVAWGIALFAESHSAWVWAALALMMAGLVLVQPRGRGAN